MVMGVLAIAWPDDLAEVSRWRLAINHAAFMTTTFAYHAGVAMIAVVAIALAARRRRLLIAGLVAMVVSAGPEAVLAMKRRSVDAEVAARPAITIMSMNVLYGRADAGKVMREVARHRPDVIVFQEWTSRAAETMKPMLAAEYPHWGEVVRDDAFGQAVCSRRAFTGSGRMYPPGVGLEPQITVQVEHDGRPLRVTNVHTLPPVSLGHVREQRALARQLAEWVESGAADAPQVLAGDFNAVSRSSVLARMRRAGMVEAHRAAGALGRGSTWPRTGMLRWVPGIKLDHVLHGRELVCVRSEVCGEVGSDHAPVVAKLVWAETRKK